MSDPGISLKIQNVYHRTLVVRTVSLATYAKAPKSATEPVVKLTYY